jgi:hypothetical protein
MRESSSTYQRAVQAHADGLCVAHGVPEGFGHLPRERAPARVGDRARDHERNVEAFIFEVTRDPEYGGLGVQRVEDGLYEQQVGPALDEPARRIRVGRGELLEADVPETGVVDVGRERRRPVRGPERAGHEAGPLQRGESVGRPAGDAGRLVVDLVGEVLHPVVPLGDGGGTERVGLDDVRTGLHSGLVDGAYRLRLRDGKQVVVALELGGMVREALATELFLGEVVRLDHGPHGTVQQHYALFQQGPKIR